jgi:hypothetical protein
MKLNIPRLQDIISPKRWRSVSIWLARVLVTKLTKYIEWCEPVKISDVNIGDTVTLTQEMKRRIDTAADFEQVHIIEQYMYRFLACNTCLKEGKCVNCKCAIPERMWVRSDHCSMEYWQPFKDAETWEKWKQRLGIKFNLTFNNR